MNFKKFSALILIIILLIFSTTLIYADDSIKVTVNGELIDFDVTPTIIDGRTLVPVRAIFEALDITVGWDEKTRTVIGTKNGLEIKLPIGGNIATKNNLEIKLDVPATIINDRTLVPVRFISESIGAMVNWDQSARNVVISYNVDSEVSHMDSNNVKYPNLYEAYKSFDIDTYEGALISTIKLEEVQDEEHLINNTYTSILKNKDDIEIFKNQEIQSSEEVNSKNTQSSTHYIAVNNKLYESENNKPWIVDIENNVVDLWKEFSKIEDEKVIFLESLDLLKDIESSKRTIEGEIYNEYCIDIKRIESKLLYDFMTRNIGFDKSYIKKYYFTILINQNNELVKTSTYFEAEINENEVVNKLKLLNELILDRKKVTIEAPEINPEYLSHYYNEKGYKLHIKGKYEEAIEYYKKAIESNSENDAAFNNFGWALNALGRYEEALPYFDKSIEIDPIDAAAPYNNKGNALKALNMYEEALVCYDKALEIDPGISYPYYGKGQTFYELEKYDESLENFRECIKLAPDDVGAYIYIGNILFSQEKYSEAIINYDKAIRLYPYIAEAYVGKSKCYAMLNMSTETIENLKKAISIDEEYMDLIISDETFQGIIDWNEFKEMLK